MIFPNALPPPLLFLPPPPPKAFPPSSSIASPSSSLSSARFTVPRVLCPFFPPAACAVAPPDFSPPSIAALICLSARCSLMFLFRASALTFSISLSRSPSAASQRPLHAASSFIMLATLPGAKSRRGATDVMTTVWSAGLRVAVMRSLYMAWVTRCSRSIGC